MVYAQYDSARFTFAEFAFPLQFSNAEKNLYINLYII